MWHFYPESASIFRRGPIVSEDVQRCSKEFCLTWTHEHKGMVTFLSMKIREFRESRSFTWTSFFVTLILDFLKARFQFLLVRWSVGKWTFLAWSALFLTGYFTGWQCDGGVSLGISNQETPYLVASVLRKLNPGKSFDWHVLGSEVQEINLHKVTNAGKKKKGKLASKNWN